jgi:hypothetical protein
VTAKGTPSSSVLAYRFPIDVPVTIFTRYIKKNERLVLLMEK